MAAEALRTLPGEALTGPAYDQIHLAFGQDAGLYVAWKSPREWRDSPLVSRSRAPAWDGTRFVCPGILGVAQHGTCEQIFAGNPVRVGTCGTLGLAVCAGVVPSVAIELHSLNRVRCLSQMRPQAFSQGGGHSRTR